MNIIERAFILCKGGLIEKKHLPESLFANPTIQDNATSLREAASACLMSALKQNNWNRLKTAKQLGMHKSTLYRKIKSLELSIPK